MVGGAIRAIFAVLAALAVGTVALPATAQDARELQLAREIVQLGYPADTRDAAFGTAIDQITAQMNQAVAPELRSDPEVHQVFEKFRGRVVATGKQVMSQHMDAMLEGMAQGYVAEFTLPELERLLAYVQTPEGHGFFSRSMRVVADPAYARATQAFMQDYLAQVPALREKFAAELTALLQRRQDRPRGT